MIALPTTTTLFTRDFDLIASNVTAVEIIETSHGFYVVVTVGDEQRYLTTRRDPSTPRLFLHLTRLYDLLRESFDVDFLIHRDEPFIQVKTQKRGRKPKVPK